MSLSTSASFITGKLTLSSVQTPFHGIPRIQLLHEVQEFTVKFGLTDDLELFKKGVLVAKDPAGLNSVEELTEDDRESLEAEKVHRWKHPWILYYTILMNSIGAAVQGWDQTGSNGANLSFPQAFGISDTGSACQVAGTCSRNSWIIGAINTAPYIAVFLMWACLRFA